MTDNLPATRPSQQTVDSLIHPETDSWTAVLVPVANLAQQICASEFVPEAFRNSPDKTAAAILAGRELNLPPMQALQVIHSIKGRVGMYAEGMRALVLRAGHEIEPVEVSTVRVIMRGRRRGSDRWIEYGYSLDDAKASGDFAKNQNYKSRPREMLTARATTGLCRLLFPDVIHGMSGVEELESLDDPELIDASTGEVLTSPQAQQGTRKVSRRKRDAATHADVAPARPPLVAAPAPVQQAPEQGRQQEAPSPARPPVAPPPAQANGHEQDASERPITERAAQEIVMHFGRLSTPDRDERLFMTRVLAGLESEPDSTNQLTFAQGVAVIKELQQLRDRAALEARVAELVGGDQR